MDRLLGQVEDQWSGKEKQMALVLRLSWLLCHQKGMAGSGLPTFSTGPSCLHRGLHAPGSKCLLRAGHPSTGNLCGHDAMHSHGTGIFEDGGSL
eukprot:1852981-Karenia_brevis.AAC.1